MNYEKQYPYLCNGCPHLSAHINDNLEMQEYCKLFDCWLSWGGNDFVSGAMRCKQCLEDD